MFRNNVTCPNRGVGLHSVKMTIRPQIGIPSLHVCSGISGLWLSHYGLHMHDRCTCSCHTAVDETGSTRRMLSSEELLITPRHRFLYVVLIINIGRPIYSPQFEYLSISGLSAQHSDFYVTRSTRSNKFGQHLLHSQ